MAELTIAIDLGSTSTRAFFTGAPFKPELLLMEPEVAEVSPKSIAVYEGSKLGSPVPENAAWIEYKGDYRAVGFLAKDYFYADLNLADSKLKLAAWKTLALVSTLAQKQHLTDGSSVRLGVLLPYGEYRDSVLLERFLSQAISNFRFRGEEHYFLLENFMARPEGFGLVSRGRGPGASLKDRVIVVVVVGYRDVSVYVMNRGIIARGMSKDLGFSKFIEGVREQTAGLKAAALTAAICRAGCKISPRALHHLARDLDPSLREVELAQIRDAIAITREQYWLTLSGWLRSYIPAEADEAIIGGGTAYYYEREFNSFFKGIKKEIKTNWCSELEAQLSRNYQNQISRHGLNYRLTDVYGFFNFLVGSERSETYVTN